MKGLKYMNNVLFRRGDQTFIDENVPLNDGQIIFNETDEAIYLDNTIGGTVVRKRYGGGNLSRSDIDMALSTTSENPIANKVVTNAIGNLSSLKTDVKTNLVSAINEVNGHSDIVQSQVSNSGDTYSSSKAYAVGDLCIYNNVLYRCITACSAGSWATNKSCFTQDTLTGVANDLNSGSMNDSGTVTLNDLVKYRRIGKVVTVAVSGTCSLSSSWTNIGALPNGFRPFVLLYAPGFTLTGNDAISFAIDVTGGIQVRIQNGGTKHDAITGTVITFLAP
jgi:hypothetical protein